MTGEKIRKGREKINPVKTTQWTAKKVQRAAKGK
jgi:hypothetical protein